MLLLCMLSDVIGIVMLCVVMLRKLLVDMIVVDIELFGVMIRLCILLIFWFLLL